jgi:hypothetical protein
LKSKKENKEGRKEIGRQMGEEEQRPSRLKKAPHLLESIQNQMQMLKFQTEISLY